MNKLIIKQNTIPENVTYNIIHKLYNNAKAIKDYEELNQVAQSQVELQGNLQVNKAYEDEVTWLTTKFPNLQIDVTGDMYIRFADPVIEAYWVNHGGDGTGITAIQALGVTTMPQNTFNNTTVTSFNELVQFGITFLTAECFNGATNLTSINTSKIREFGYKCLCNTAITSLDLSSLNSTTNGSSIFEGCSNLQTVIPPNQTYTLGKGSFKGCSSLTSIDLSNCINNIFGDNMFENCTNLVTVTMPDRTITQMDNCVFQGCTSLTTIDLSQVLKFNVDDFNGCTSLTNADLSSCQYIGGRSFQGCTSLTSVDLSSCSYVGASAFRNCTSLTTVTLGTPVEFATESFVNCPLQSITNTQYITSMGSTNGNGPFDTESYPSLIINNPDFSGVTTTGMFAFRGLSGLTGTLTVGSITNMRTPSQLFKGCSGLTKIVINSIPSISSTYTNSQNSTFSGCDNLKILDIGNISTITLSKSSIISSSTNFKAFVFRQTTPPTIDISNGHIDGDVVGWHQFVNDSLTTSYSQAKIYVPNVALSSYSSAQHWSNLYNAGYILSIENDYNEQALLAP